MIGDPRSTVIINAYYMLRIASVSDGNSPLHTHIDAEKNRITSREQFTFKNVNFF